jgi:hypothetical protein
MTNAIIVVGAQWHSQARGAAYIFGRNSNGNWVQRQRLVRVESQINDLFGGSVAVDRGMILVGAPGARPPELDPERQSGVVYGFLPGTTQYLESFRLHPPEGLEAFEFGLSIAMFDKYIAVGAARLVEFFDPGDAVVSTYSRDGSSVLPLGIVPRTPNSTSISIANNLLLVGSPYDGGECTDRGDCRGQANLYHLNRFAP